MKKTIKDFKTWSKITEEAPVNNVGSGNIAGVGIGPKGEPGISKKKQISLQRKNKKAAQKQCSEVGSLLRRQPPQVTTGIFCGKQTFIVPESIIYETKVCKKKYGHWSKFLPENDLGLAIREWANDHPHEPVILEGDTYGHIVYVRYSGR
jgi:hypothetical protein